MNKLLKIVLVGAGGYGRSHLQTIAQMEAEGLCCLTDVVDPWPEHYPETEQALSAKNVRWHRTWEDLIVSAPPPDCVAIAAPIHLHLDYACKAHATGAYVYLEKPPVPLLGQMEALIAMEQGMPRIQVGFAFPYSTQMRVLRRWIRERRLGNIISYRMVGCYPRADMYYNRNSWAGKLRENGSPVFDGPATNALAHRIHDLMAIEGEVCGAVVEPMEVCAELYRARPIESYDVCSARGMFPSGATFALSFTHAAAVPSNFIFEIKGDKGQATIQGTHLELTANFTPERVRQDDAMILGAFRHFLKTAGEKGRPSVGLAETRPYVATTNAMMISSGGIHPIEEKFFRRVETPRGIIYDVTGMEELCMEVFRQGRNFSEVGAPWGIPGKTVSPGEISATMAEHCYGRLSS